MDQCILPDLAKIVNEYAAYKIVGSRKIENTWIVYDTRDNSIIYKTDNGGEYSHLYLSQQHNTFILDNIRGDIVPHTKVINTNPRDFTAWTYYKTRDYLYGDYHILPIIPGGVPENPRTPSHRFHNISFNGIYTWSCNYDDALVKVYKYGDEIYKLQTTKRDRVWCSKHSMHSSDIHVCIGDNYIYFDGNIYDHETQKSRMKVNKKFYPVCYYGDCVFGIYTSKPELLVKINVINRTQSIIYKSSNPLIRVCNCFTHYQREHRIGVNISDHGVCILSLDARIGIVILENTVTTIPISENINDMCIMF